MNGGNDDERQFLRRAALKGIGHALRRLFETEHSVPDNIRQLVSQIEARANADSNKRI